VERATKFPKDGSSVDKVEALRVATEYNDRVRFDVKVDKSEAVRKLAAFDLFSPLELSLILDTSIKFVERHMGWHTNMSWPSRVWNIHSLSVLYLLALDYRRGHVNKNLIRTLIGSNNSLRAISELTDIPIERLREVVNE
jgi:hypothetical protein